MMGEILSSQLYTKSQSSSYKLRIFVDNVEWVVVYPTKRLIFALPSYSRNVYEAYAV